MSTIDQETLGRRLRDARNNRDLTHERVGDALGLPRTAIVKMEAGERSVSTHELSELADLYRRPVSFFFSDSALEKEDLLVALYRVVPELQGDPELRNVVENHLGLCQEAVSLQTLLGRKPRNTPPTYSLPFPQSPAEAIQQGFVIALNERKRLELGSTPIADMGDLVSEQGIWASGAQLRDELSGLFLHHKTLGLAILVNYGHGRARKRFSYAHEYAHALLDRDSVVSVSGKHNSGDLIEKRANAFAAEFLMPRSGVASVLSVLEKGAPSREQATVYDVATGRSVSAEQRNRASEQDITYLDIALIAYHFGTSYQATAHHLRSLRYLNRPEHKRMLEHEEHGRDYIAALGLRFDQDGPKKDPRNDRELVTQIVHLAFEAYRREVISQGRFRDLIRKLPLAPNSRRQLLQLAEASRTE